VDNPVCTKWADLSMSCESKEVAQSGQDQRSTEDFVVLTATVANAGAPASLPPANAQERTLLPACACT